MSLLELAYLKFSPKSHVTIVSTVVSKNETRRNVKTKGREKGGVKITLLFPSDGRLQIKLVLQGGPANLAAREVVFVLRGAQVVFEVADFFWKSLNPLQELPNLRRARSPCHFDPLIAKVLEHCE